MVAIQEQLKNSNIILLNVRLLEAASRLGNRFPLTTWDRDSIVLSVDVELGEGYAYYTWSYLYPGDVLTANASAVRRSIDSQDDQAIVDAFNRLVFNQALTDIRHATFNHTGLGTFIEF